MLQIEFDGFKKEFYKKYNLFLNVRSKSAVTDMKMMFDKSEKIFFCETRPVMWQADVYTGTKTDGELLFTVNSTTEDEVHIIKGRQCYKNDLLVETIFVMLRIDKIRDHDGPLSQEQFMLLLGLEK
jgi:hypothetical protein